MVPYFLAVRRGKKELQEEYEEGNVNYSLAYDEDMNLVSFTM